MGPLLRRVPSVRKKKQDTPLKTGPLRKTGLKKQMGKRSCEVLPEEGELHVHTVHTVQPMVPQMELVTGAERSDSASSLSLVIDTSFSSEQPSLVDTSSTLPSPEVFREENSSLHSALEQQWEPSTFPVDLTDPLIPKNSTLLDLSQAETILMHPSPNLSTIMDAPTILSENGPQDLISNQRLSENCKTLKAQTPPALLIKKIFFKKQVWFQSPLFSEKGKRQNTQSPKPGIKENMRKHIPSSPHQNIEPEAMNTEEKEDMDGEVFFDFVSDSEEESYFSQMRERCSKLNSAVIFPLTAARGKD